MSERTIRYATRADAEAIGKVQVASWQRGYRGLLSDETLDALDWRQRAEFWTPLLPETVDFGATVREERAFVSLGPDVPADSATAGIGGFLAFGPAREDVEGPEGTVEVKSLYVTELHWGDGTSGDLMAAAIESAAGAAVALWVLEGNIRGRRFYEKWGFRDTGLTKTDARGGDPIAQVMYLRDPIPTA